MRTTRLAGVLLLLLAGTSPAADFESAVKTLQSVGPEGEGNAAAAKVWKQVAGADAKQLPRLLAAMDDAGPLADNWLRTAVDTVAERQLRAGGPLPVDALQQFALDTNHDPRARRTAFGWLVEVDPSARPRLLANMLDDPSLDLRRDAVAQVIGEAVQVAELNGAEEAKPLYRRALASARDPDQVKLLAARLRELGDDVDLARHYGFILDWKLIGPFDNVGEKGFDAAYLPEQSVDFEDTCQGKNGQVGWIDYTSEHDLGQVDLNRGLVEEKGVLAYAASVFVSEKRQEVELRLTTTSELKLWVDGKLIAAHNVYHAGSAMDQYVGRAVFEPGNHLILVKICQNEQTQSWTKNWGFRLRVCDQLGTAVLSADRN